MLYKIRWINDDTLITKESYLVMLLWLVSATYHLLGDASFAKELCNAKIDVNLGRGIF